MAKESIGLPDILRILGDRPFEMKETVKDYLYEMQERERDAKEKEDENAAAAANTPGDESSEKKANGEEPQDKKQE